VRQVGYLLELLQQVETYIELYLCLVAMGIITLGMSMGQFFYSIIEKGRRQDVLPILHNAFVSQDPVGQKLLEVEKQLLIT
jgi:hypothetical protein